MNHPQLPGSVRLCELRLGEITRADTASLTEFAECRLAALGGSPSGAADVAQRAFLVVLKGLEMDQGGRKPRLVDVQDKPAFMNYLRGVVSSIAEAMTRRRRLIVKQKQWDDNQPCPERSGESPSQGAEMSDLEHKLFERLRERAPQRLMPTIDQWETIFRHSDRIPAVCGRRKYVSEVRHLAREILSELGGLS